MTDYIDKDLFGQKYEKNYLVFMKMKKYNRSWVKLKDWIDRYPGLLTYDNLQQFAIETTKLQI